MFLSDQLLESALPEFRVDHAKCTTLDLYSFERGHTELVEIPLRSNDALRDWIAQRGAYVPPRVNHPKDAICGSLRLLYILGSDSTGLALEQDALKSLIVTLGLPKTFPADTVSVRRYGKQYVANIAASSFGAQLDSMKMTFVSPSFQSNAMEMTLTYMEATKTTYGVLRVHATDAGSPQIQLLPTLRQSLDLCGHPLLLPAVACNAWYEIMANQYGAVHNEVRDHVQFKTNLMPNYFISEKQRYEDFDGIDQKGLHEQYEEIHQTIVEQHNYLSNGLSYFVHDFSRTLKNGVELMLSSSLDDKIKEELRVYVDRMASRTTVELNHRERLLSKLDIQIQVLYTLMQQRDSRTNLQIADETKRDSSAMKTLSLITIIFLPLTAVASVFSMNPFISVDPNDGSRIQASTQFWIYWAVVLPLTGSLVLAWVVWINRKQLLKRGKKQHNDRFGDLGRPKGQ